MELKSVSYTIDSEYSVKHPQRGTPDSAGVDIYCPEFTTAFVRDFYDWNQNSRASIIIQSDKSRIAIPAHEAVWIPTGLYIHIPKNYYVDVATKSGFFKRKRTRLKTGSHVIDSDYQGMIIASFFNTSKKPCFIFPKDSIAQLLVIPVLIEKWEYKDSYEEVFPYITARGTGGFGSTDQKKEKADAL